MCIRDRGFSLALDLPDQPLPSLEADEFLLRRALNNLLINCVRHNPPGAVIRLGARQTGKACLLWVENTTPNAPAPPLYQEEDGGPAHGTGLKLVAQILSLIHIYSAVRIRFSRGTSRELPATERFLL